VTGAPGIGILALSGSLRAASINSALLRAAARLSPPSCRVTVFESLGALPLFNPDRDASPPPPVLALRQAVGRADALIIASPEYAHGVSGAMKNALDWLVSFEGFVGKPVAVLNSSPRAHHACEALIEILLTMSAKLIRPASVVIPLLGSGLDEEAMMRDRHIAAAIRGALETLSAALGHDAGTSASFPV
jgi:chromate reductase